MDGTRFDSVARSLASGVSRRSVLKGAVAALAAAVTARTLPAVAAVTCTPPGNTQTSACNTDVECCANSVCVYGRCRCASGYKGCGSTCIPTNQVCTVCNGGGPIKSCTGGCTDTRIDERNCGACGNSCGLKQTCSSGHCCGIGTVWCNGACRPLAQCA